MNKKIWVLLPLSFLMILPVFAQEKEKKRAGSEISDSTVVMSKGRIMYKNRIYRQNAPYLTIGYGAGFGFESRLIEQNLNLSYHHFIRKFGLQLGYHTSSDIKVWWRSYQKLNDLFLGAGRRWEGTNYNLSVFAGPSLAYGSYIAWNEERQKDWAYGFTTGGLHAEIQATYKPTYDIGIGLSVYGSVNRYYSVAGAEIHLFFSTAFVRNYN
jgi:hypothetical protein